MVGISTGWLLGGSAVVLFLSAAIAQTTMTVAGSATYRERIALPPNAVFEVTLEDVARADAPAEVIGRTRLDQPGQPPFHFSIQYDPARIVASHRYHLRARVTVAGDLMFTTDQSYPVLTQGNGSQVAIMIMRRAGISTAGKPTPLGELPATFVGVLPCADCPGIRYALNLFPDNAFFLRLTYLERLDAKPFDDIGRWNLSADGPTLTLKGGNESSERFAVKSPDVLRKLDLQGPEIDSKLNYDLHRTSNFEPLEPSLTLRGAFRYMADAPLFTDCRTGQRWPVAMQGDYKALEAAYLQVRRQPGEELMATLEGQVAIRPNPDGGRPIPTLVVERYIGIWPGETCGATSSTASLQETYWKLTRIADQPVIVAPNQREPNLVFRTEQSRVTGSGGCNSLTGAYKLNGSELIISGVAATRMACIEGMDTEAAFFKALENVRSWKILGQHLELYDSGGNPLVRLEARP